MVPKINHLLIIDDNHMEQRLYRTMIQRAGTVGKVTSFYYAQEGLDFLLAQPDPPVDCIILDINMPRMTGFEFLEAATASLGPGFVEIVVVMLTTSLDIADRRRAESFPVVRGFFSKPLQMQHLEQISEMLSEGRELQH